LPFGRAFDCRLPYSETNQLTTTTVDSAVKQTYFINSLFDPNKTGVGHQPYQYDQIKNLYTNYRVYDCEYDISISNPSTDGAWVGIIFRTVENSGDDPTGLTLADLRERRLCEMRPLSDSGQQKTRFTGKVSMAELSGQTWEQWNTSIYAKAAVGSNPSSEVYLEIILVSEETASTAVTYSAFLNFHARLTEYIAPAQS
jgi:hypothetical protein